MFIAFVLEGIGIYALLLLAGNPVWFVVLSGVVFVRLGRNLLVVSSDLRRHFWKTIRHHELRFVFTRRKAPVVATGAPCQRAHCSDQAVGARCLSQRRS